MQTTIETLRFFRAIEDGNIVYYATISREKGRDWVKCLRLTPDGSVTPDNLDSRWLLNMLSVPRERMRQIDETYVTEATNQHLAVTQPERLRA